jgi:hypothetical protein
VFFQLSGAYLVPRWPCGAKIPLTEEEWRDGLAEGIDALDHHCPFTVTRLGQLCLATAIRGRDYHAYEDNAHHEPSLVEVVDIVIYNTVLSLNVSYESKPLTNNL